MEQTLIDSHAHLIGDDGLKHDSIQTIEKDNLEAIVCVGTMPLDVDAVVSLANDNKNIYAAIAYHPEYASEITQTDLKKLKQLAKNKRVVAIGECGLDYHYTTENKHQQKELLRWHINLAIALNKPIMLHLREAEEDALEIFESLKVRPKDIVVHCYSSVSSEVTKRFVALGAYFGFSGNFTFKKYRRQDIHLIPQDRLLVETDTPYLSPEPMRGRPNQPKNVHIIAQAMADELQMSAVKLKQILTENTKRVYGI